MAKSYVTYNNQGFWVSDSELEVWLYLLVYEIDRLSEKPNWLINARQHWLFHATAGFLGCINASLPDIIDTEEKRKIILDLAFKAKQQLLSFDTKIPSAFLTNAGVGGGSRMYDDPVLAAWFIEVGDKFIQLLNSNIEKK